MSVRSLFILGRQAGIGMAELESLYGSEVLQPLNPVCMGSNLRPTEVSFNRLGGTVKLAGVLGIINSTEWHVVRKGLTSFALQIAEDLPEGKLHLGLSTYGTQITPNQLTSFGLELKKTIKSHGYSVRLVPNNQAALSSAQVLHNHLTGERGMELLLVYAGSQVVIGRSVAVQNITAYARRDQARPKRDAFIGMLPPKLAQIIINLATAGALPGPTYTILDPFCGTGVIVQEALLMGYPAYGSDIDPRMVSYSQENLEWLTTYQKTLDPILEVGDATSHTWHHPFSTIATEAYLGSPLSSWPSDAKLAAVMGNCNVILERFLQNVANQLPTGARLCVASPVWLKPGGADIKHLPLIDQVSNLGYNRVSFRYVSQEDLIYYRPSQLVGRELLVLVKK